MSADLYFTLLRWAGGHGCAKLYGDTKPLTQPPQFLPGHVVQEVDYAPEVHFWRIRVDFEGWRDMRADEARAADQFLTRAHGAAAAA